MKLKIERMTDRIIKTSRRDSKSLSIMAGGKWYSAWAGDWNADWAVGSEIEIEDGQIEKTKKGDKEYLNIKAPKDGGKRQAKPPAGDNGELLTALRALYKIMAETRNEIAGLRKDLVASKSSIPLG